MISDEDMRHLAGLARLELSPEESAALQNDLNEILGYFEQLGEVDTEGLEELARPVAAVNVLRPDEPGATLPEDVVVRLAVEYEDGFFRVPRTVDADA